MIYQANVRAFDFEVHDYHEARIAPPDTVRLVAESLIGGRVNRVVDLGAGTGLSSALWVPTADSVIAVEPNHEMRNAATTYLKGMASGNEVHVMAGSSDSIPVQDEWADLVTCGESLHWMKPEATHPEISRVLRAGGCLLAYGYTMPPTVAPAVEIEYRHVHATAQRIIREHDLWPGLQTWQFEDHQKVMDNGRWYHYIREAFCHQELQRNGEWFVRLASNHGPVSRALARQVDAEEIGISGLREVCDSAIGRENRTFIFHYKMLAAVK